jgi:pimeloyl-ACP methyl ester carboxylesterase
LFVLLFMVVSWLVVAQTSLKFRTSDDDARADFAAHHVKIDLQTAHINGAPIHYATTGAPDKPTIFFIHGSPGSWSAFDHYLMDTDLLQRYRLISIDRPGFGYSDYGNAISISDQAVLIGALIQQLQNGKPFYLAGHSLGGPLAVKLAAHYSTYISGIVLLAASVDPHEEKAERWRPILKLPILRLFMPGAFRPSNIELWAFKKDVLTMPDDLHAVKCPVWIVQGMKDPLVPPGNAFYAQKELINSPSVQLTTLPDANHFIPWKYYDDIKKVLLQLPQ